MAQPVTDLRAFLRGTWCLERRILDRVRGARAFLAGEADFREEGDELAYCEAGTLEFDGQAFEISRAYRYRFPEAHVAEIRFADGGPFHALDLSTGAWAAIHLCKPDLYRGRFRALAPDLWLAAWWVTGPRKDQILFGRYRRGV